MAVVSSSSRVPEAEPGRVVKRRHPWRWVVAAVAVLALVVGAAVWVFSGMIRDSLEVSATPASSTTVVVLDVAQDRVTLDVGDGTPAEVHSDLVYGLAYDGGFAQLTGLVSDEGSEVTRELVVIDGAAPVVGQRARVVRDAFPDDPAVALGDEARVREIVISDDAGDFPAWFAPAPGDTWAVLVHGKGSSRTEVFRLMQTTVESGMPSLAVSYRHDVENGGGLPEFGVTEWPEVEAAVGYALDHGAHGVVLVGVSMGGAIEISFLEHSALAASVVGVVLDAPALDYTATVLQGADNKGIPAIADPFVRAAIDLADVRFGLHSEQADYVDDLGWVRAPVLVVHGTDDHTNPYPVTRRLAEERPDLVRVVAVEGAGHVDSWNADPEAYRSQVAEFLGAVS